MKMEIFWNKFYFSGTLFCERKAIGFIQIAIEQILTTEQ